jgi:anti-sigma factor RsiW
MTKVRVNMEDQELSQLLRMRATRYQAPGALRARLQVAFDAAPTPAMPERASGGVRAWGWLSAAGAFAFGVVLAMGVALGLGLVGAGTQSADLTNAVVASHVRSLMASHLMDVASTDQHTVKPWFNGKVDFSPPVSDFAGQGYPLVGGRLDYLEHRTVAALVYRRNAHPINLFVWPDRGADAKETVASEQGYHVVQWRRSGMRFAAVSDVNTEELKVFADLVRERATTP